MADKHLSPRQKMIGMMYLVLTALLALNVSKEILNAFVVVNEGLERTINIFSEKNEQLYTTFDQQRMLDPKKVMPYWQKAQEVKKLSIEMGTFIEDLKKRIVMETEGLSKSETDTMLLARVDAKDNYDVPTQLMIGDSEDGSAGQSRELKKRLDGYKSALTNIVDAEDRPGLKLNIDTRDPKYSEEKLNWENYNFYNTPMAAAVTILSKMQSDVKNAEAEVVDLLLKKVYAESLRFDTVAAKVIPQSNYVMLGEEYKADVFIAAFNKTINPQVLTGDYDPATQKLSGNIDTVPVSRGLGKYSMKANKEGFVKWGGVISLKSPKGKVLSYPFESEYIVARPALTVSADKMTVMYAGVENPISVSVPGIANENLSVSINNGSIRPLGGGKFMVTGVSAGTAVVSAMATMADGERRSMGTISFKVKNLPKPSPRIGELTEDGKMAKNLLMAQQGIRSFYENFDYQAVCNVTDFTVTVISRNIPSTKSFKGNLFSEEVKNMINIARKNDKVYFEDISAMGPDGKKRKISSICITVN